LKLELFKKQEKSKREICTDKIFKIFYISKNKLGIKRQENTHTHTHTQTTAKYNYIKSGD